MGVFNFFRKDKSEKNVDKFTQQMIDDSYKCIDSFKERFNGLDFSINSLNIVDDILEEVSDYKDEMSEGQLDSIVHTIGSYVFEVARRNFGGKYFWYEHLKQPILVTGQPNFEISLLVIEKVKGRIQNGSEDNIPFFFQGYVERIKNAKRGDQAMIV
jgi:hypothetical protein